MSPTLASQAHLPVLLSAPLRAGMDDHRRKVMLMLHLLTLLTPGATAGWQVVTWGGQAPVGPEGTAPRSRLGFFPILCLPSWRRTWVGRGQGAPSPFSCQPSTAPEKLGARGKLVPASILQVPRNNACEHFFSSGEKSGLF